MTICNITAGLLQISNPKENYYFPKFDILCGVSPYRYM
jgi:hypothetical protein